MVHDFVHVPLRFTTARDRARAALDTRIVEAAEHACAEGSRLYRSVAPASAPYLEDGRVRVDTRPVRQTDSSLVIPLRWGMEVNGIVHPAMDANVELTPLGPDASHLTMWATAHPPALPQTDLLDRHLFECVSAHSARAFLRAFATILTDGSHVGPAPAPPLHPHG